MRILFLGAGGIGGYFGGRLAAGGADVTFLVRPGRALQLRQNGLVINSPLGSLRTSVRTIEQPEGAYDLVVLACKAPDLPSAVDAVRPAVGNRTVIVPLLNGLRHLDFLDEQLPQAQVLGGLCHIGAALAEDGEVRHLNNLQHLALGPRRPEQFAASEAAWAAFSPGGFSPLLSLAIMQDMWEKFTFLASYAGLTCLMQATVGAIAATEHGKTIARELLTECAMVAKVSGFEPRSEFMGSAQATLTDERSDGTSSMLRDMLRGHHTEHDQILGDMLARALAADLATPILRLARTRMQVYEIVRATSQIGAV